MTVSVPSRQSIIDLAARRDGVAGYSSDFAWFQTARVLFVFSNRGLSQVGDGA